MIKLPKQVISSGSVYDKCGFINSNTYLWNYIYVKALGYLLQENPK
jgi:hypothetical protein